VQFTTESDPPYNSSIAVDGESYHRAFESEASSERAYVLLARLRAGEGGRPTFLIAGQTSVSNHAAVRYLVSNHAALARKYGTDGTFVLVLEVVNPGAYGPDVVELASDITAKATARPVAVTV
jgi:hypothetical protein